MVKLISIMFILSALFISCQEKSEGFNNSNNNYALIDSSLGTYKLVQFYYANNNIKSLGYLDLNTGKLISEYFTFSLNGELEKYSVFDQFNREKYVFYYKNKSVVKSIGDVNITLDSICLNNRNEYLLFFSYARLPYYEIKPKLLYIYENGSDPDTIIPKTNGNCFFIVNSNKSIPKHIQFELEYTHLYRTLDFSLANIFETDTVKLVKNINYKDWFYFKNIDYNKIPFSSVTSNPNS